MRENFKQTNTLLIQYFKRDWLKILLWILAIGLFSAGFVPAFEEMAKGQGLQGMFETLQNPAMIAIIGPTPVESVADYTLGAMYANEMLLFCSLFSMVIAVLHVISHTRKEEELGLTELVRSFQVGRQANSLATIIETVLINVILALFISGIMLVFNTASISTEGALLFGTTIGMAGVMSAGIALITAQIMPNASGATGTSLGIIGVLYIIRAGTDVSNTDLSLINPLGWTYLTHPFTENNWVPLIFAVIFCLVAIGIAFFLEGKRDMGSGYLPEKEGKAHAKKSLLSIPGLFIKINKGIITAWLLAFVIIGAAYGSIYGDMAGFLESNEFVQQMFTVSGISIEESFTSTIMLVMIFLVAILPINIVSKLFVEEKSQHLSQLFTTKVSRAHFYWTTVALAIFCGLFGILLAAGSLASTAIYSMDTSSMSFSDFLVSGYNLLPAVLFYTGVTSLFLGWAPKWEKIVYVYLGYSFILSYFGDIVDLPEWFFNTSVENWLAHMPTDDFNSNAFFTVIVISVVFMLFGYLGYRQRDMIESV